MVERQALDSREPEGRKRLISLFVAGAFFLLISMGLWLVTPSDAYVNLATRQPPLQDRWKGIPAEDVPKIIRAKEVIESVQDGREARAKTLVDRRALVNRYLPFLNTGAFMVAMMWSAISEHEKKREKKAKAKKLFVSVLVLGGLNAFAQGYVGLLTADVDDLGRQISATNEKYASKTASLESGNAESAKMAAEDLEDMARKLAVEMTANGGVE